MPRYKLTIAYDGTDFCGWQKQEPFANSLESRGVHTLETPTNPESPEELRLQSQGTVQREGEDRPRVLMRTVQHVVERAVREVVREPVVLMGASRTDSGVHAKGQVAAFTCSGEENDAATQRDSGAGKETEPTPQPPPSARGSGWPLSRGMDRLILAMNGRLPPDVMVMAAEAVPPHFNPIGDCTAKAYSYTIHAARQRPLWDRRQVTHVWETLDANTMNEAAKRLIGEHDFAAFAAAGHGRLSTIRTIFDCRVTRTAEDRIRIDVSGNGFLYNMVRIIAGTLTEVGRGRKAPGDVTRAIESKDRRQAGSTMPPEGLCLEWIRY